MLDFKLMKKASHTGISILLLIPFITGMVLPYGAGDNLSLFVKTFFNDHHPQVSFEKPCDMDHCNPYMPKCPLCPSPGSVAQFLNTEGAGAYLPTPTSSFIVITSGILSDQGVVKSIFHPPLSIL
jgi:hypothetical protein